MEQPNLDMQMFASVKVLQSQQEDMKSSIKALEEAVDRHLLDKSRLKDLEDTLAEMQDSRKDWVTWALQTVGSIVITTAIVLLGAKLGVNVSW